MSPAARVLGACRALAVRTRPIAVLRNDSLFPAVAVLRTYSADTNSPVTKITGSSPKETTSGSGSSSGQDEIDTSTTSVMETLDDATLEQIFYGGRPATSDREGGLTAAQEEALYREGTIPPPQDAEALVAKDQASQSTQLSTSQGGDIQNPGHKFGLPKKPCPEGFNLKKRYHPVLEQLTRLLMRDGKLSVAQRNVAMVMNFLRTAPAPIYSPKFPLLPGTPPASHLPLNPVLYITIAIDSVAPLLKVRNIAGAGGGGRALELPVPLAVRQRRRMAIKWVLDVIEKKPSKGSGKKQFPHRIAEEIIAVVEGRSGVWEKRKQVHKLGTAARANVGSRKLRVKKKM
ncbi:hypothetical protein EsDP_00004452 [Epichloe bromicola]|uniref:Small ribosomal subunit protein uS7 domain-containing protein n=1 Tax=Epichloe bromicola TaxID=79588 RepID=A0ABQ0CRR7_9HYPO